MFSFSSLVAESVKPLSNTCKVERFAKQSSGVDAKKGGKKGVRVMTSSILTIGLSDEWENVANNL